MKAICLYFQVHQPFHLRKYRFFEMGEDHYYYDDYQNRFVIQKLANECYLPMNDLLFELIQKYKNDFKISFSFSGTILELLEQYAPEVLKSFKKLVKTGNVEVVAETYSHSLASLKSKEEFQRQVELNIKKIEEIFKITRPKTFCNTELVYSDNIGEDIAELGFKTILTEGPKHVLGWKSPNYLYTNSLNPKLNVLLRNFLLSDDITFRFTDRGWDQWPLTADKFTGWLKGIDKDQPVVNLFFRYETFGSHINKDSGIFDFIKALPMHILNETTYTFKTPTEISKKINPVSRVDVPYPISWADEERDISSWMGNELQEEAMNKLYDVASLIINCKDDPLKKDWERLQTSENLFFMNTKWYSAGDIRKEINPYENPYNAFINYMNVLSDLLIRLKEYEKEHPTNEKDKFDIFTEKAKDLADELEESAKKVVKKGKETVQSFDFDKIAEENDKKIKQLIKEVDVDTWAKALDEMSDKVIDKIVNNMIPKVRKQYNDAVKNLKKSTEAEIKKSKQKIENVWKKL